MLRRRPRHQASIYTSLTNHRAQERQQKLRKSLIVTAAEQPQEAQQEASTPDERVAALTQQDTVGLPQRQPLPRLSHAQYDNLVAKVGDASPFWFPRIRNRVVSMRTCPYEVRHLMSHDDINASEIKQEPARVRWWRRLHLDCNMPISGYVQQPKLFCPRSSGIDVRVGMHKDLEGDVHLAGLVISLQANKL